MKLLDLRAGRSHTIVIGDITCMRLFGYFGSHSQAAAFANTHLVDSLESWSVEPVRPVSEIPWGALGLVKPEETS